MGRPNNFKAKPQYWLLPVTLLVIAVFALRVILLPATAAELGTRVLQLQNDQAAVTTDYQLDFNTSTAGTLGSVSIQFCSNDPLEVDPCVAPTGFDATGATIVDQSGPGDFTIATPTSPNEIILTRTPSNVAVGNIRVNFNTIVNPSDPGSYYARVETFATPDASGTGSDYGGIAFAITSGVSVSAEVPPYLIFCTGITISGLDCANAVGDFIDFGELSTSHVSSSSSQMLVATNAEGGYNITVHGTTMTSGTHIITALASNDVSRPGTAQFGFNLRANSTPADGSDPSGRGTGEPTTNYDLPNSYRFNDGDTVVNTPQPDDVRLFTSSYIVNVPSGQAPGIYVSTLTYVCLADF